MTVNKELLQRTLNFIEQNKALWQQDVWHEHSHEDYRNEENRCGTVMCFAGWAATLDGCRWVGGKNGSSDMVYATKEDILFVDPMEIDITDGNRKIIPVSQRARRILGLSAYEANRLFNGSNDLTALQVVVRRLCDGKSI